MVAPSVDIRGVAARAPIVRFTLRPDRRFWITLGLISVLVATNVFLVASEHQPLSVYGLFVASAIMWVCALPLWLFLVGDRRNLGFLPAACGLYALYFAQPAFSARPLFRLSMREPVWSSVEVALSVALVGIIALVYGSCGLGRLVARMPRVRREIDLDRALPVLVFVSLIGFSLRFTRREDSQFDMIVLTMQDVGVAALGGLLLAWLRGQAQWWHKVYFVALLFGIAAVGLVTGMLANTAFPIAGLVFLYCWERGRFPVTALLVGALLLAPFQVSKKDFRVKHWSATTAVGATSPAELASLLQSFVTLTVNNAIEGRLAADDVVDANAGRTDMLSEMALVVAQTPESVPYWDGYTYSDLAWHFIPRVLVPDKPAPGLGQEFPRRYGLIDYANTGTSFNLSQTVEFYVNFGWTGVVLGMFLLGLMYAMLNHSLSASSGGAVIGSIIFSNLMNMESNFSGVWGGIPLRILAFYAFVRMLPLTAKANGPTAGGLPASVRVQ